MEESEIQVVLSQLECDARVVADELETPKETPKMVSSIDPVEAKFRRVKVEISTMSTDRMSLEVPTLRPLLTESLWLAPPAEEIFAETADVEYHAVDSTAVSPILPTTH